MGLFDTISANIKDNFANHTILGRYLNGDSLGDAIKNDFNEDTILGQLLSGKDISEVEPTKDSYLLGVTGGLFGLGLSIFTDHSEQSE